MEKYKITIITIAVILVFNSLVLFFSIKEGIDEGDLMLRFHERQAVTFLSSLMLGFTSVVSLVIYLLKRKAELIASKGVVFWLFSGFGFFYLCMDEYFMAHEGMDDFVAIFQIFRTPLISRAAFCVG